MLLYIIISFTDIFASFARGKMRQRAYTFLQSIILRNFQYGRCDKYAVVASNKLMIKLYRRFVAALHNFDVLREEFLYSFSTYR